MHTPLRYQLTNYDCGPTTMLNAVSCLFQREDIPPEIVRNVMLYSLDCYSAEGAPGRAGTSRMAMQFLASWLDGFGRATKLPLSTRYLAGNAVSLAQEGAIADALVRGGVAVVRLFYDVEHYVLLTGLTDARDGVFMFDPWYVPKDSTEFSGTGIVIDDAHPFSYNRIVPLHCFTCTHTAACPAQAPYALGPQETREAVLLFNDATKKAAGEGIEYFI
ncbi:MAG: peptidase C39 [Selenomonadaceae bacterium]|nr:peptidase C39 [Selenomonadaceae bacterium]